MFRSALLAVFLASASSQLASSPLPSPTPEPDCLNLLGLAIACGGDVARFPNPTGPPKYLSFRRPPGATVTEVTGKIAGYSLMSERVAIIPNSSVCFSRIH